MRDINLGYPLNLTLSTGDVLKLLSQQHWEFARELIETYGPVAKLHNFFGVRDMLIWTL